MPTLQAFEADTLEAALARVTEEVGRGARIKQAEKIRTGGVAGFFAKERYEVTVEIDERGAAPTTTPGPGTAKPAATKATAPAAATSLLDLADQVSREERGDEPTPAAEGPTPSTEGQSFQDVLRSIASEAGFFDGPEAAAPAEPAPEPPRREPVPFVPERIERIEHPVEEVAAETAAPQAQPEPETDDSVRTMLTALGVPGHLLGPAPEDRSVAQHVLGALERIPSAAPVVARRGDVVVVVGDPRVAAEAADLLAGQVGQTAADVVWAGVDRHGFNTLSTPDQAERQAALWRSCGAPFVVAVCPPEGAAGISWTRAMLEALEPVAVWAAVRADRKPDDVTAWLDGLGTVDALAVGACADTCSPAAVLSTGVPVAALEGRRATPAAWTALLVERLAA